MSGAHDSSFACVCMLVRLVMTRGSRTHPAILWEWVAWLGEQHRLARPGMEGVCEVIWHGIFFLDNYFNLVLCLQLTSIRIDAWKSIVALQDAHWACAMLQSHYRISPLKIVLKQRGMNATLSKLSCTFDRE